MKLKTNNFFTKNPRIKIINQKKMIEVEIQTWNKTILLFLWEGREKIGE
jgi:hypothetical protein